MNKNFRHYYIEYLSNFTEGYYIVALFFFFSGGSSLLYQVIWVRFLSLFFGSDVYATTITLTIFMAGLAIGSQCAGIIGDRILSPILVYAILEILTGITASLVPYILSGSHGIYQSIYNSYFDAMPWLYNGFRVIIAAITIILPATLMGATLPILARYSINTEDQLGLRAGNLYAINTVGALVGTLLTGFVLLPMFGMAETMTIGVLINVSIGFGSIIMHFLKVL